MQLRDGRPTMDPGMCFLCEKADDCRYVDTLFTFEPLFFSPLIGRKFVCENCVAQMGKLLGLGDKEKIQQELDQANTRIQVLESNALKAQALLDG